MTKKSVIVDDYELDKVLVSKVLLLKNRRY